MKTPSLAPTLMLAALALPATAAEPATAGGPREWNFQAQLDGKPIGEHRFRLETAGEERQLDSDANFTVKILGITAYRYRHHARETWRGDCLAALEASTDDDGKASRVQAERQGDALQVDTGAAKQALPGCVMSFAYWNPALRSQSRLLNAQTGKLETVQVQPLGHAPVEVHGQPVDASGYRISGAGQPIDVWYSPQGDWIGLDSLVGGKRRLSYRLP